MFNTLPGRGSNQDRLGLIRPSFWLKSLLNDFPYIYKAQIIYFVMQLDPLDPKLILVTSYEGAYIIKVIQK